MSARTPPELIHADLTLKVEYRDIAELRSFGRQARTHPKKQIKYLSQGMKRMGFLNPILIDEAGAILAGHARVEAAKLLGYSSVPAIIASHLSTEEKRAYVIAENRISELGEWDKAVLGEELRELAALDLDFCLDITGFETLQIEALSFVRDDVEGDEPGFTVSLHPTTRLDDVWVLGQHRVHCADATKAQSYDILLVGEKVRAVWTDPPFNVAIRGHVTSAKDAREFVMASGEMSDAEFTEFLRETFAELARALVDGGVAYVVMDWRHAKHLLEAAAQVPFTLINICIWDKGVGNQGSFYRSQHEMVFVFRAGTASFLNNVELGRHGRDRTNVWAYKHSSRHMRAEREAVPTPKPVNLVRDALLDCTAKGDLILDAFGGGGSALIAAERIGRRARLLELDPAYCDVMIRRWEAATGREAVLLATGCTFREVTTQRAAVADAAPAAPSPSSVRIRHRPTSAR